MKKFISILTIMFFFTLLPTSLVNAQELTKEQKIQYKNQIKEKRQIIKKNAAENKKLELKIDDRTEELGKVIMMLFDRELPPSEEKLSQIESKQEVMLKNLEQIANVQRSIKRLRKEASINVNEEKYQQAIENFNKVIVLQGKEKELLIAFDKNLQDFIELIKSLQYK
ncbi:hypothetical protein CLHOM_31880 [Clostridium homopropionicum DSM 5847]|uniref:Uncharacterized protein n=1 Tax=Clostridium homopropionicum DSM 5847 TaxID=1121318 RepID=A0A0L6Z5R0_9CLOT|nr:hypothetical protein [Clostridium homopropionicum]KOA18291.1 hypothetical protein CLHOM_31880 [Clostridium homopropionicum DSM 5847]SFF69704.1 hypothetical protein SAMN04488501_101296 [Clostridium homopropionicum]